MQLLFQRNIDFVSGKDIVYAIYDVDLGLLRVEHLEDNLDWEDLQEVKNQVLGEDVTCVEYFPQQGIVFNEASTRFLWVLSVYDEYPNLSSVKKRKYPDNYKEYVEYALRTPLATRVHEANKRVDRE